MTVTRAVAVALGSMTPGETDGRAGHRRARRLREPVRHPMIWLALVMASVMLPTAARANASSG